MVLYPKMPFTWNNSNLELIDEWLISLYKRGRMKRRWAIAPVSLHLLRPAQPKLLPLVVFVSRGKQKLRWVYLFSWSVWNFLCSKKVAEFHCSYHYSTKQYNNYIQQLNDRSLLTSYTNFVFSFGFYLMCFSSIMKSLHHSVPAWLFPFIYFWF